MNLYAVVSGSAIGTEWTEKFAKDGMRGNWVVTMSKICRVHESISKYNHQDIIPLYVRNSPDKTRIPDAPRPNRSPPHQPKLSTQEFLKAHPRLTLNAVPTSLYSCLLSFVGVISSLVLFLLVSGSCPLITMPSPAPVPIPNVCCLSISWLFLTSRSAFSASVGPWCSKPAIRR